MNYDHKKLIETITKLDELPTSQAEYATWITAEAHLAFLRRNAGADEVVVYASGEYTFVQSLVVPNANLAALDRHELMNWNFMPDRSIASYVTGGGRDDVWIERSKNATQLIFGRTFEGWSGPGHCYYELHQEYAHLAGIHWRPERRAYCRYDGHGDLEVLERVNTPLTASRDEWAEAFMDLAKLVIEGFETKGIRAKLDADILRLPVSSVRIGQVPLMVKPLRISVSRKVSQPVLPLSATVSRLLNTAS